MRFLCIGSHFRLLCCAAGVLNNPLTQTKVFESGILWKTMKSDLVGFGTRFLGTRFFRAGFRSALLALALFVLFLLLPQKKVRCFLRFVDLQAIGKANANLVSAFLAAAFVVRLFVLLQLSDVSV